MADHGSRLRKLEEKKPGADGALQIRWIEVQKAPDFERMTAQEIEECRERAKAQPPSYGGILQVDLPDAVWREQHQERVSRE